MTSDLILGIIGGIIATTITVAASYFFKTIAIPFIKSALFDIPNISGKWYTHDNQDQKPVGTATIKQHSRQIEIKVTRNINRDGNKTEKNFCYKGKFASGTLVASYEDTDMKGYIMGSVVMRLMPDNKTLFGKTVYFDHNQGEVVAHDYWLKR
ncbi:hypothetical protein QUF50_06370 [Thiotrichales bacterium HSG1]|nr:hypothetical protein [Thiotrichales bacterium HSG1]